jgi:periplasmic divalent cation tolerance protein
MLMVLTTVPNSSEGRRLAGMLVYERLAACVQVLPEMTSIYRWEGEIEVEAEHLLLIKTADENWEAVRDAITKEHSYSVPEIVAIKAENVSGSYAEWLAAALRG